MPGYNCQRLSSQRLYLLSHHLVSRKGLVYHCLQPLDSSRVMPLQYTAQAHCCTTQVFCISYRTTYNSRLLRYRQRLSSQRLYLFSHHLVSRKGLVDHRLQPLDSSRVMPLQYTAQAHYCTRQVSYISYRTTYTYNSRLLRYRRRLSSQRLYLLSHHSVSRKGLVDHRLQPLDSSRVIPLQYTRYSTSPLPYHSDFLYFIPYNIQLPSALIPSEAQFSKIIFAFPPFGVEKRFSRSSPPTA